MVPGRQLQGALFMPQQGRLAHHERSLLPSLRSSSLPKPALRPGFLLSLYSHNCLLRLHQPHAGCPRSHFTYILLTEIGQLEIVALAGWHACKAALTFLILQCSHLLAISIIIKIRARDSYETDIGLRLTCLGWYDLFSAIDPSFLSSGSLSLSSSSQSTSLLCCLLSRWSLCLRPTNC